MGLCIRKAGKIRCCWGVFFLGVSSGLGKRDRDLGYANLDNLTRCPKRRSRVG